MHYLLEEVLNLWFGALIYVATYLYLLNIIYTCSFWQSQLPVQIICSGQLLIYLNIGATVTNQTITFNLLHS